MKVFLLARCVCYLVVLGRAWRIFGRVGCLGVGWLLVFFLMGCWPWLAWFWRGWWRWTWACSGRAQGRLSCYLA